MCSISEPGAQRVHQGTQGIADAARQPGRVAIDNARLWEVRRTKSASSGSCALRSACRWRCSPPNCRRGCAASTSPAALSRRQNWAAISTITWPRICTHSSSPSAMYREGRARCALRRVCGGARPLAHDAPALHSGPVQRVRRIEAMNTILHERQLEEHFCTLCYAFFDFKARTLSNSRAAY